MINRWLDLLSLSWPVIAGMLCVVIFLFPRVVFEKSGTFKISLLDFISIEHVLHRGIFRFFSFLLACIFFAIPAFRDYSRFFPDSLKVVVYFDDVGIERVVESLAERDVSRLSLAPDWQRRKKIYLAGINTELEASAIPFRFRDLPGQTSATGELKFKTQPIEKWGAQQYRITESKGSLVHTTEAPGTEQYKIVSEFELVNTEGSLINGSIKDVYLYHGILIMPVFKQLYRVSPSKEVYHHSLIAATRIEIFPYIDITKTIYLLPQEGGKNIPIAYGIYSPL